MSEENRNQGVFRGRLRWNDALRSEDNTKSSKHKLHFYTSDSHPEEERLVSSLEGNFRMLKLAL